MEHVLERITDLYFGSEQNILPCLEIQQMVLDYYEIDYSLVNVYDGYDLSSDGDGWLMVRLEYQSRTFKEIKQMQMYSPQSLIGNAGGYIGLFVGYTLRELPIFIRGVYNSMKKLRTLCIDKIETK